MSEPTPSVHGGHGSSAEETEEGAPEKRGVCVQTEIKENQKAGARGMRVGDVHGKKEGKEEASGAKIGGWGKADKEVT